MLELLKRNTQYVIRNTCCVFLFLGACAACAPRLTPTYFIPPTAANTQPAQTTNIALSTSTPLILERNATPTLEATPSPEPTPIEPGQASPTPTATCTNILTFLEDITVTDGTVVAAGETFVKQWRVKNDGTCDWDSGYLLKLVSGDALGAPTETALYPARAGAEAVIEMTLTAPQQAGPYHTVWQAIAPDGLAFEQAIYVDFVAQ